MTTGVKDSFAGDDTNNNYVMEVDAVWQVGQYTVNAYTGQTFSIAGLNRSYDDYNGMGGTDSLNGTGGNDAVIYNTSGDSQDSDPAHYVSVEQFFLGAGNDVLNLTSGQNGATSYAGATNLQGNAGNDTILGGASGEIIVGDFNVTTGGAFSAGADFLYGGAGNDTIFGDGRSVGNNVVLGNDILDGGTGNDLLFGDGQTFGSDFTGTRGHNTFIFDGPGSGQDQIGAAPSSGSFFPNGFQHGLDHIQLDPSYGYSSATALLHTADNAAGNAVVDLGHGDTITLYGVHAADLTASDFIIAATVPASATGITGLGAATINDTQTVQPFAGITLTDNASSPTESVTVTWNGANGTLSDGSSSFSGTYSISGTTATVQSALRGLTFTPVSNQVAPGNTVSTTFSISDSNGAGIQSTASEMTTVTSVDDAPTISGTRANQPVDDTATIKPFATARVADVDAGAQDSLTITLSNAANGTLAGAGLSGSNGVYTLTATDPATLSSELQALVFAPTANQAAPGQTVTTNFTLAANDGLGGTAADATSSVVARSINDPASIGGVSTGSVTEDGTLAASGTLSVSDPDVGQAMFSSSTTATSTYGAFSFDAASGQWTYALNNAAANVQALARGQQVADTLTVQSLDGTASRTVMVTVTGADDAPTINAGPTIAAGAVVELSNTTGSSTPDTVAGSIAFADVDLTDTHAISQAPPSFAWSGGALTAAQQSALAAAGTLTLGETDSTGTGSGSVAWSYSAPDKTFDFLAAGQTLTATYVVTIDDGLGGMATQPVTITVTGSNDVASISGNAAGTVQRDTTLSTTGQLSVSDPDAGQNAFKAPPPASLTGTYGAFTFDPATGQWTYALANSSPAVRALTAGQQVSDTLNVMSLDGTAAQPITVTITGTNHAPVLGQQQSSPRVTEGQTTVLATVSDPDPGDLANLTISITSQNVGGAPVAGFLYLDQTTGVLTYTADGYNAQQPTDAFTYTVSDAHGATASGSTSVTVTPSANLTTQLGTPASDTLTASSASRRLIGGDGADTLNVNAAKAQVFAGRGDDTVNVNAAQATIYGGPGANTINLGDTANDTIVLQQGGSDSIFGFKLKSDVLDLSQVLAEAHVSATLSTVGKYLTVTNSGSNATLSLTPAAQVPGYGAAVATLQNVGAGVTLQTLINAGALKVG